MENTKFTDADQKLKNLLKEYKIEKDKEKKLKIENKLKEIFPFLPLITLNPN